MFIHNLIGSIILFVIGAMEIYHGSTSPGLHVTMMMAGALSFVVLLQWRREQVISSRLRYPQQQESVEPIDWRFAWPIASFMVITVVVGLLACVGFIPHTQPLGPYLIY